MYALVKNGEVAKYPCTIQDLKNDNPNTSFPLFPKENVLNAFDVFVVDATEKPNHNILTEEVDELYPSFINNRLTQQWSIRNATPEEIVVKKERIMSEYENALANLFNSKAKEKNYDNYITCSLRAGYSGPYQQEGIAFAQWMDNCNFTGYQILNDVESGIRTIPSIPDFLAEMPTFDWNNI